MRGCRHPDWPYCQVKKEKKMKFLNQFLVFSALAFSCGEQETASFSSRFDIPDSVKPCRLYAVFDEPERSAVSLLAPGNERHPTPRKITYFDNGEIMAEELKNLGEGHFQSLDGTAEYRVENGFVTGHYHPVPECLNIGMNLTNTKAREEHRFPAENTGTEN